MRQRVLVAIICLLIVFAAGVFAWRRRERDNRLQEQQAEWQTAQRLEPQLDQVIGIRFSAPTPVEQWIREFARQTGVQIVVHADPTQFDPADRTIVHSPGRLPAREALRQLAQICNCQWRIDESGEVGLYPYDLSRIPPTLRTYQLDPSLPPDVQRQIAEAVGYMIEPDSWSDVGGPGELLTPPGAVAIAQRYEPQVQTQKLLHQLQTALAQANALPAHGLSPDDPALQPVPLQVHSDIAEHVRVALAQPVSFDFADKSLNDCIEYLVELMGVTIVVPISSQIQGDAPVTCRVDKLRFDTALRLLLSPHGAHFEVVGDGEVVKVVPFDEEPRPEHFYWYAYPIPDFPPGPFDPGSPWKPMFPHRHADPLAELLTSVVQADSWTDVGGPGCVWRLGNLLIVDQTRRNHDEIFGVLRAIRAVRSGDSTWTHANRNTPGHQQTRQLLQQPLTLQYQDTTLRDFAADVAERSGLRVALWQGIAEVGVTPETKFTWNLPARPLDENLSAALAELSLAFVVHDWGVAITAIDYFDNLEHRQADVIDIRHLQHEIATSQLNELLIHAVEPDAWSDVGGPSSIEEFRGLLVVSSRPELIAQVRHVIEVVERRLLRGEAVVNHGNLLTRSPRDSRPNTPPIHLYDVHDLLKPDGQLSQEEIVAGLRSVFGPDYDVDQNLAGLTIHANQFLIVDLHPNLIERFEAKLRELREQ